MAVESARNGDMSVQLAVNLYKAGNQTLAQQARYNHSMLVSDEAVRDAIKLMMTGAAFGVGARGLSTLNEMVAGRKPIQSAAVPQQVLVPVRKQKRKKIATEAPKSFLQGTWDNFLGRGYAKSKINVPAYLTALMVGTPAAAVGGYELTDWVLDKQRKSVMKKELEQAKQEYQTALMQAHGAKQASDSPLSKALERLSDALEKSAAGESNWPEWLERLWADHIAPHAGTASGLYLSYAGTTGLAGLAGGLHLGKKMQQRKVLEEAQRLRAKQLRSGAPGSIIAAPLPVMERNDEEAVRYGGRVL